MRFNTIHMNDGTVMQEGNGAQSQPTEKYVFYPEDYGFVQPPNPNKKKNRDRLCQITGKYRAYRTCTLPQVKWLDTGTYGYVDPSDLLPATDEQLTTVFLEKPES